MDSRWWSPVVTVAVVAAVLGGCGPLDGAAPAVPAQPATQSVMQPTTVVTGPVHVPGTMRAV